MASYIVLEPTAAVKLKPAADRTALGDHTLFVRDEFSLFAVILPVIWLLFYRLWWHALMFALISWGAFSLLGTYLSSAFVASGLSLLLSLLVGLEGRNWYLASLRRKGYYEAAQIDANDLTEAETLYFYDASTAVEASGRS